MEELKIKGEVKGGGGGLAPPSIAKMAVPLSAPQRLPSTSSATGNPRNKCALAPGHSLMDWIRLGTSGIDLAGTNGKVVAVSKEELAKHNQRNDAWMAIRGNVYNVTKYLDFHPGGVDELMKGVGKDATKLFEEIHSWVNYPQLLGKCFVGPLKQNQKLGNGLLNLSKFNDLKLPSIPSTETEITPRLDWIQKKNEITFYFYTKQFCNPGLVLERKSNKFMTIRVQIDQIFHDFSLELQDEVQWPPNKVNISAESGKLELVFGKMEENLWTTYGTHSYKRISPDEQSDDLNFEYRLTEKQDFNDDSFEMLVENKENQMILIPPLGYHLFLTAIIEGAKVSRSFTPVQRKYLKVLTAAKEADSCSLCFLVKSYKHGLLSSHLKGLTNDSSLRISLPKGNFKLPLLTKHRSILFLAAGSGLTPFLNLLEPLLKRTTNRIDYLKLAYFNKTEDDIWCKETLDNLSKKDERFEVDYILSRPSSDWSGRTGHINKDLLTSYVSSKDNPSHATFVAVCGPTIFNQLAVTILKSLNFNDDSYHIFQ